LASQQKLKREFKFCNKLGTGVNLFPLFIGVIMSCFIGKTKNQIEFEEASEPSTDMHKAFEWVDSIVVAIIVVVILFTFVFRIVGIIGDSMRETLHENDRLVISNFMYTPERGDIVVISRNYINEANNEVYQSSEPIIKRVIATENQVVDIDFDAGIVYVDGVALDEPYTRTPTNRQEEVAFPLRVSEGHVFVLGDNRNDSMDSRFSQIGLVDKRFILGKALFRVYPFDQIGGLYDL